MAHQTTGKLAEIASYPAAMAFNPARDIPDLSGKVILVTGGNVCGKLYC